MTQEEFPATELLQLARGSIEYGLRHGEPSPIRYGAVPGALLEPGATFTTLRIEDRLRGCCGTLEAVLPIAEDVARSAFEAAFKDPRFDPVVEQELSAIRLEVSLLSPLETMAFTDEADLLRQLNPGTDGLVIFADGRRATFLPQVWEMFPDPRRFLAALKTKCGLKSDFWSGRLVFQRYRTTPYAETPP